MNSSRHQASVSRATPYIAPELSGLRERTYYLLHRAYQNLYGMTIPDDQEYQHPLFNAALQLMQDLRARTLNDKQLLHAFEDIIRISDEHTREARKHLSRASNPVYLRETALDNVLEHQKYVQTLESITPESQVRGHKVEHSGRMARNTNASEPSELLEAACHQLAEALDESAA